MISKREVNPHRLPGLCLPLIYLTFLAGLILVAGGCRSAAITTVQTTASPSNFTTTQPVVKTLVNPAEALSLIAANQGSYDFVILDVRTADEFASGHLANSLNIDIYQSDFKTKVAALARDKKYLVYCRTGVRSAQASTIMLELGFTHVYDMSGGITQWVQSGNPTVK